jgi:hypothetical protein
MKALSDFEKVRWKGRWEKGRKKGEEGRWEIENRTLKTEALRQPATVNYGFRQEGCLIKSARTIPSIDYGHGPSGRPYGILSSTWN